MNRLIACALGGALCLLPLACNENVAGSAGTGNTGKGTIAGRVLGADGKGVVGARITVVAADHNPGPGGSGDVDAIAVTASDGSFRTDSLPEGYYNLLGAKGSQVALVDSVAVSGDSGSRAGDAVLKAPGSVTGVIRLRPGDDSRTVFLILMGTTTFAVPRDSIGNFTLSGLAEGAYRLRLLSVLDDYAPKDTLVEVEAGKETVLEDTLRLADRVPSGLPVIDSPSLRYDSALMQVEMAWNRRDPSRVEAYNVYRRAEDSAYILLNSAPVTDTFFVDGDVRVDQVYDYAVTCLDALGNEGLKGRASAVLVTAPYRIDTVSASLDCEPGACNADLDRRGNVWIAEWGGGIRKLSARSGTVRWNSGLASNWTPYIRADPAEGIYLLVNAPLRLARFDTLGGLQWVAPLPFDRDSNFDLDFSGDTVLVWTRMARVMTYVSDSGKVLGTEALLNAYPAEKVNEAKFRPGIGFFAGDYEFEFLDRAGKGISRWTPERHDYCIDMARDGAGNWYLAWDTGEVDVYTPDRKLRQRIRAGLKGRLAVGDGGAIYMWPSPERNALMRLRPGI